MGRLTRLRGTLDEDAALRVVLGFLLLDMGTLQCVWASGQLPNPWRYSERFRRGPPCEPKRLWLVVLGMCCRWSNVQNVITEPREGGVLTTREPTSNPFVGLPRLSLGFWLKENGHAHKAFT